MDWSMGSTSRSILRKSLEVLAKQFGYEFATDGAALHVFSTKQVSPGFFSEPQPQPRIPRWRFWAKQQSKPRVSRASLTMQDHDFIVKNGARKIDGSLPLCRSQHRRNMRILYDGRVFQFQKAGGVN